LAGTPPGHDGHHAPRDRQHDRWGTRQSAARHLFHQLERPRRYARILQAGRDQLALKVRGGRSRRFAERCERPLKDVHGIGPAE
jgi:hypothetical protein